MKTYCIFLSKYCFVIILLVLPIWGQDKNSNASDEPTKQETIDFIKSKLDGNSATFEITQNSTQKMLKGMLAGKVSTTKTIRKHQVKFQDISVEGCQLKYTLQMQQLLEKTIEDGYEGKSQTSNDKFENYSYPVKVDLSKLDPASIKVEPLIIGGFGGSKPIDSPIFEIQETYSVSEAWVLVIDTAASRQKGTDGELVYSPALPNTTVSFYSNNFLFEDREIAKRLSRAFQHLVTLCGGKVDPF